MSRIKTTFRCTECGGAAPKWVGRCPACGGWNSLLEELDQPAATYDPAATSIPALSIVGVGLDRWATRPTGVTELDRVLGGGVVPGSVTLIGGEPGVGKSTLILQAAARLARPIDSSRRAGPDADADAGVRVLYISAEESLPQVRARAERLGALAPELWLAADTDMPSLLQQIEHSAPAVVVIDSIQTIYDPALSSAPGSVAQVRQCAARLVREAKARDVSIILVGHVTKEGALAGPRVLEHLVDTVLSFDGDRHHALRLLRAVKHRFGPTDQLGVFEMTGAGLEPVPDPSRLFLADRREGVPGSVVVPTLDGYRPLLVEMQALVASSTLPAPRRSAQGVDAGRLATVLAVLEKRLEADVARADVYALAVGGVRVAEPGADLGLALAIISSLADEPVPADIVVCGEIGLGGELRQVHQCERRLAEAARLGFGRAVVPRLAPDGPRGITALRATTVGEAVALAGLPLP
jgi:DNA repair protein RadA/Sms